MDIRFHLMAHQHAKNAFITGNHVKNATLKYKTVQKLFLDLKEVAQMTFTPPTCRSDKHKSWVFAHQENMSVKCIPP